VRFQLLCCLLLTLLFAIVPTAATCQAYSQRPNLPNQQRRSPEDEEREKIEKEMAKQANKQRQAELKRDTAKLLELATELQHYVDKSNENVLSVEVIRKAEEIEKLAHSVKEKMRGYN
jgi:flagellar motility protein MotE (MotC chaperone)